MTETPSLPPQEPLPPDLEGPAPDPEGNDRPQGMILALTFLSSAVLLLACGGLTLFMGTVGAVLTEVPPEMASLGGAMVLGGLLLALSGWALGQWTRGRALPDWMAGRTRLSPLWGWGLWLVVLALGAAWSAIVPARWWGWGAWLFHPLAMGLPPLLLAWGLARRQPTAHPIRRWMALSVGFLLASGVIVLVEIFALIVVLGVLVLAWWGHLPSIMAALERSDFVGASLLLRPLLRSPWVPLLSLGYIALFVPLVEEAVKPLYLWWHLARENLTPGEGFVLGAVAGAGYGLFEAVFINITIEDWATLPLVRALTTVLHVALTAWVGVGLVRGVAEQRPWLAGGHYALAVLLHGAWNAGVLMEAVNTLPLPLNLPPNLAAYALTLQGLAGGTALALLLWGWRRVVVDNLPQSEYH